MAFCEADFDFVLFGGGAGGGKTFAALCDNLQGVHDPLYMSAFFRTTTTEISKGLWLEAQRLYKPILFDEDGKPFGKAHISEKEKCITFPSGAKTYFSYLELDRHADQWYGLELAKIYFEEIQFRTWYQFNTLRSRNRTMAKVPKGIRGTCNPDPTHFSKKFASLFLDEANYPIKELSGKKAHYVIVNSELHVAWKAEDLLAKFPEVTPLTYTYIPATVEDNAFLLERDPTYKDTLNSLPEIKRKQLLLGCWENVENTGMYFQRDWLHKATHVPLGARYVRGWDTANSIPDPKSGLVPDWTVGVKIAKAANGDFYICGMDRFQERPGPRDSRIISRGKRDGDDCFIVMGVDAGPGGKFQFQEFSKTVLSEGLICRADPTPNTRSKLTRFEPFSAACQNGLVHIVESTFEPDQLEIFYSELERFDGERSLGKSGIFDDIPDACASGFSFLAQDRRAPIVIRNQMSAPTLAQNIQVEIKG